MSISLSNHGGLSALTVRVNQNQWSVFSYLITKVDLKYGLDRPIYYATYTRASRTLLYYRVKSSRQRAPKIITGSQSEMMGNALFRHA
jgi:hypothetical protein